MSLQFNTSNALCYTPSMPCKKAIDYIFCSNRQCRVCNVWCSADRRMHKRLWETSVQCNATIGREYWYYTAVQLVHNCTECTTVLLEVVGYSSAPEAATALTPRPLPLPKPSSSSCSSSSALFSSSSSSTSASSQSSSSSASSEPVGLRRSRKSLRQQRRNLPHRVAGRQFPGAISRCFRAASF